MIPRLSDLGRPSKILSRRAALATLALLLGASRADAADPAEAGYQVEVKVIEAWRTGTGAQPATALDPALAPLQKDLKDLPFQGFRLVDGMQKVLHTSEAFNLQFGKPEARRFLRIIAMGAKAGKLRLDVAMENNASGRMKDEFRSDVSITEGSTLVVVAAKQPVQENVILLAITVQKPN